MHNSNGWVKTTVITLGTVIMLSTLSLNSQASEIKTLPSAGIDYFLGGGTSVKDIKEANTKKSGLTTTNATASNTATSTPTEGNNGATAMQTPELPQAIATPTSGSGESMVTDIASLEEPIPEQPEEQVVEETVISTLSEKSVNEKEREIDAQREEESFKNLVIAQVTGYVYVRSEPDKESEDVGKLYNKSVGKLISEKDGWYEIESGSCHGYVKAEYCVTGDEAVELAKKVGRRICTVDTTTLHVREEPSTDATILGLVPQGEDLTVLEEMDGWVKAEIEEGQGYVSLDYVKLSYDFVEAESKEAELARLEKERIAREEANAAANKANKKNSSGSSSKGQTIYATGGGSQLGKDVANYGLQFVGNPYVYGGSSLTNGTDCSGFVMSVYSHFGVSLPHSSKADRSVGYAVDGLANAQPGDLICYSGHVALYIGGGQIVHASTAKTGIKVSNADYRSIVAIRRIF